MKIEISRQNNLSGEIKVPGDKSISHRAVILSSLARGQSRIRGFLESEDCLHTVEIFRKLGIKINKQKKGVYTVSGSGLDGLQEPQSVLDCGNSGTGMRILTGLLSAQSFYSVLTGDKSLCQRPMERIISPLEQMGAQIWSRRGGMAPLSVRGQKLAPLNYELPVASAQVKSSLIMAGLASGEPLTITEPGFSRDHTERMLKNSGVPLDKEKLTISLPGGRYKLTPLDIKIPGDISSAAFFIAAALITENSSIILKNVGLNPTRSGFLEVIDKMGGSIDILNKRKTAGEPVGDLQVKSSSLSGIEIRGDIIPRLIDEIPVIAVLAARAEGRTLIRDAEELRVKETDRIEAMVNELSKMGVSIAEYEDGMIIEGPSDLQKGDLFRSYGDHRVAMSLAVAGLCRKKKMTITNCECINTSFPEFEEVLAELIN